MKILVLLSRVPYPLDKGDKLRAYYQLEQLSKQHEIILCCLSDADVSEEVKQKLNGICAQLHIFKLQRWRQIFNLGWAFLSSKPFQVHYFYQRRIKRQLDNILEKEKPDHIYAQLVRVTEYVKNQHFIPKTLDFMDALSKGMGRQADQNKGLKKWIFNAESKRLLKYEHLMFEYFDVKTIISEQDRELIYHEKRKQIHIIPNGVDVDFFAPQDVEKHYTLVFNGNMSYPPNVDSAVYLAETILPKVQEHYPEANLLLSGTNPSKKVLALMSKSVDVPGWMDDIREAYAQGLIFIAPMKIGTGLQNKLLEAMSMEMPSITSDLANRALKGKDGKEVLIGNSTEEYVQHIVKLLESPAYRDEIAKNGKAFIHEHFGWKAHTETLSQLMEQA